MWAYLSKYIVSPFSSFDPCLKILIMEESEAVSTPIIIHSELNWNTLYTNLHPKHSNNKTYILSHIQLVLHKFLETCDNYDFGFVDVRERIFKIVLLK